MNINLAALGGDVASEARQTGDGAWLWLIASARGARGAQDFRAIGRVGAAPYYSTRMSIPEPPLRLPHDAPLQPAAEPTEAATNGARPSTAVGSAIVLAAGQSHRLRAISGGGSKTLLRLGGMSLLDRAVGGLLDAGVGRIIVVVGHDGKRVAAVAKRRAPDRVHVVEAEKWHDGNGSSLSAAEPLVEGEGLFAVQTCDHIFGPGIVDAFVRTGEPAVLVDDSDRSATDEETKVTVVNGRAVAFGKHLGGQLIDCGLFLLPQNVFEAHRQGVSAGDSSLSGALTILTGQQGIHIQPVPVSPDGWWHDVDTPDDLHAAKRRLLTSLRKSDDGPVSRWLNRPLSTRLSMALSRWQPEPNLLSGVGFAVALLAALACGLAPAWPYSVVAGALVQMASVLDGLDGEAARLQRRASPRGALLDGVLDRLGDAAIVAGMSIWALRTGVAPEVAVGLGCAAVTASFLSMAIKDRASALRLPGANDRVLVWALGGRDGRCLMLAVFAAVGLPAVGLAVVTVSAAATALARLWRLMRVG